VAFITGWLLLGLSAATAPKPVAQATIFRTND
jgi:hypothetical protein